MFEDWPALGPINTAAPLLPHPLNAGRVMWLYGAAPLDGGRQWYDLCGRHHGTLTNGPTWARGPHDSAGLSLTAASVQYASVGRVSAVTDNFTMGAWLNGGAAQRLAIYIGTDAGGWGMGCGLMGTLGGLYGGVAWIDSGTAVPAGWYHLMLSRAGGTTTVYLNGRATGSTSAAVPRTPTAGSGAVGTELAPFDPPATVSWQGLIADAWVSEVGLTARAALSYFDLSRRGYPGVLRRAVG